MALLNDLTISQLLSRLVAFLLVTAIHGFALAGLARLLGDQGPRYNGRFTLNPVPNMAMLGLVMALLFRIGWILPMRIDPAKLRFGRWGLVICIVGSLLAVLVVIPVLIPLRPLAVIWLPRTTALAVLTIFDTIQDLAIWFVAFNVIPVPPLTAGLLFSAIKPSLTAAIWRRSKVLEVVMLALVVVGAASVVVEPIYRALRPLLS